MNDGAANQLICRRTALRGLLAMMASGIATQRAYSGSIPRAIVVPFSAGGPSDLLARKIAELLTISSGSSVIVENVVGAGGYVAMDEVLSRPRDGATLLLGNSGLLCSAPLLLKMPRGRDPQDTLVPICTTDSVPFLLFAGKDFSASNLTGLRQLFKESSNGLTFATNDIGSANHIAGETVLRRLGLKGIHVPYRNTNQGVIDVVKGRVQLGVFNWQNIHSFLEMDRAKVLAALSDTALELIPQARSVADQGFGKFDIQGWNALFVASGTPQPVVDEYGRKIQSIFVESDIQAFIRRMGNISSFRDQKNSIGFVNEEIQKYRNLLKQYRLI